MYIWIWYVNSSKQTMHHIHRNTATDTGASSSSREAVPAGRDHRVTQGQAENGGEHGWTGFQSTPRDAIRASSLPALLLAACSQMDGVRVTPLLVHSRRVQHLHQWIAHVLYNPGHSRVPATYVCSPSEASPLSLDRPLAVSPPSLPVLPFIFMSLGVSEGTALLWIRGVLQRDVQESVKASSQ